MKVAILFAGRIKAFEYCASSFKHHILGPLTGHQVDGYAALNSENTHTNLERFIAEYNIRKYDNILLNINLYNESVPLHTLKCCKRQSFKMYYCWHHAFKLMEETGISYDIILYMRADQIFSSDLNLPTCPLPNILYIPSGEDHTGLNDQMAFGNYTVMKHYTNIYNCIEAIYNRTHIGFHTETYVGLHNIGTFPIQRFHLSYKLHPARH